MLVIYSIQFRNGDWSNAEDENGFTVYSNVQNGNILKVKDKTPNSSVTSYSNGTTEAMRSAENMINAMASFDRASNDTTLSTQSDELMQP